MPGSCSLTCARSRASAGRDALSSATGQERGDGCKLLKFAGSGTWLALVLSAVAALP